MINRSGMGKHDSSSRSAHLQRTRNGLSNRWTVNDERATETEMSSGWKLGILLHLIIGREREEEDSALRIASVVRLQLERTRRTLAFMTMDETKEGPSINDVSH